LKMIAIVRIVLPFLLVGVASDVLPILVDRQRFYFSCDDLLVCTCVRDYGYFTAS
jgi:hypothetical protein